MGQSELIVKLGQVKFMVATTLPTAREGFKLRLAGAGNSWRVGVQASADVTTDIFTTPAITAVMNSPNAFFFLRKAVIQINFFMFIPHNQWRQIIGIDHLYLLCR
jgi:hypothetical protein